MGRHLVRVGGVAALLVLAAVPAAAQFDREVISRGKTATALVEIPNATISRTTGNRTIRAKGTKYGSAVCIRASGIYITNAHVVKGVDSNGVRLVIAPNRDGEKTVTAKVIRQDAEVDLAVLRVDEEATHQSIAVGDDSALHETMQLVAFGYPFGKALASDDSYPDISVNVGRITSLRKTSGMLDRIQLDAQLNPGNSGGPVLDAKGQLVAVVASGVFGTGVNFAIPASRVAALLDRPDVRFSPPKVPYDERFEPVTFEATVTPLIDFDEEYEIELRLEDSASGLPRTFRAERGDGHIWRVTAPPAVGGEETTPPQVTARIAYPQGRVECRLDDRVIRVGDEETPLSKVRRIVLGDKPAVHLHGGSELAGEIGNLGTVDADLGSFSVALDLSRARTVELEPIVGKRIQVSYALSVKRGGQPVHEVSGELTLLDSAVRVVRTAPAGTQITPFTDDRKEIKLPSAASDVIVGGSGRYLLFVLDKLRKLAVFDCSAAEVVKYVPLASTAAMVAAGAEKLVIVDPDKNILQRISLGTFEKELTKTLPMKGVVKNVVMGSASHGPILVHWAVGSGALDRASYTFLDLDNFETVDVGQVRGRHSSFRDRVCIRASASGEVFGLWALGVSPSGLETMSIAGGHFSSSHEHTSAGAVVPNTDGSLIFTSSGAIYTTDLKRKNAKNSTSFTHTCIPSYHPSYYLTITGAGRRFSSRDSEEPTGTISLVETGETLVTLPELSELKQASGITSSSRRYSDLTLDKRVHYLPQADLLITLAMTDDQIVLRRINLKEKLDESGIDYLYVSSLPVRLAHKGMTYTYPVSIESRQGSARCKLTSGPEGMTIEGGNRLVWTVPSDFNEEQASVVLTISDASGQEVFHTFSILVK